METRLSIEVVPGPGVELSIDADQIEQMLINLVRNAAEAALESTQPAEKREKAGESLAPAVIIRWELNEKDLTLKVEDNGPGLLNPSNVFVPFYTTKPSGSGIGLVLSRQIAEAHGGSLELLNGKSHQGCVAKVVLPYSEESAPANV
jgi:signal transduction histidine kinase